MRKWNTILSVLMLLIFMIHGIMGSFMLNGVGSSAGKLLAWIGVGILVVHTVIGRRCSGNDRNCRTEADGL